MVILGFAIKIIQVNPRCCNAGGHFILSKFPFSIRNNSTHQIPNDFLLISIWIRNPIKSLHYLIPTDIRFTLYIFAFLFCNFVVQKHTWLNRDSYLLQAIIINSTSAKSGDEIELSIRLECSVPVSTIGLSLVYDESILEFLGYTNFGEMVENPKNSEIEMKCIRSRIET